MQPKATAPTSTVFTSPARQRRRLTRWDLAGMAAGLLYTLVVAVILSRHRVFWEDEMLGWLPLQDPSWHHMLRAYNLGADGGGFLFYLLGRGWLAVFGSSEISFRLLSSTCFGLAFAVTWAAARRFYATGVVAFALFDTWFFSPPFVQHIAEGRFYGLLILTVAIAVWLTLVLAETSKPTPGRFYPAMFLAHGALTTSHLLGAVFSAALMGALVVLDLLNRRPRPWLYLPGVLAWLLLLPERTNILATAGVGKPHFWTKAPRLFEIVSVYTGSSKEIALVVATLLLAAVWSVLRNPAGPAAALSRAMAERRPVYVLLAALLLLPVAFLLEGLAGGTWLFNDRYLLPITVAVAYLTAELLQLATTVPLARLQRSRALAAGLRVAFAAAFALAMGFWDFHHLAGFSPSPVDFTAGLTAELPKGIPVVCEDAFSFTELIGRQHASGVPYTYLLDWTQSLQPTAPALEVTQYHLMENWRRAGYFADAIEPVGQFLQQHKLFLVLHESTIVPTGQPPEIGNPLTERLAHDPAYQVLPFLQFDHGKLRDSVSVVCRGRCGPDR